MRQLTRASPTKCHIGEVGAVVGTGRIPHARDLFPIGSGHRGKARIAVGPGMHLGDFQAIGARHRLRVDFSAAETAISVAKRRSASPVAIATASAREVVTTAPAARKEASRVTTMLVRPGSGLRGSDSKVLRPITTGLPIVIALSRCMSDFSRHGMVPPAPITPFSATATMRTISVIASPAPAPSAPAADPAHGPLVHQHGAQLFVEFDRRRIPVQHRPLQPRPAVRRRIACARCASSALPMPLPRCAGRPNRSSR